MTGRMPPSWESRIIESLCDSKRCGYTFDQAWRLALREFTPRSRDVITTATPTLFDETGAREIGLVEAFHGYADDAWHGRRPELRAFGHGIADPVDETSPAGRPGHVRRAA